MDCKRIIENGYGKLAEKLPDYEKGVLDGFKGAIEALENYKANKEIDFASEIEVFQKIGNEIAELMIDGAASWLESEHDMLLISFVDNNHYSIDADGTIVDDEDAEND